MHEQREKEKKVVGKKKREKKGTCVGCLHCGKCKHLVEYLIFSTLKKNDMMSLIHCVLEGAFVDFQFRRRWRLVIKDIKEITSKSLPEY